MLFWGFSFVWAKIVFEYYHPITTIFLRLVISSLFLFIIVKLFRKKQKIQREDYGKFALLAFYQPFLYFLGESFGLNMVTSTIGSVIISTIPVFTPVVSFFTIKEKLSVLNIFGLIISFMGVLCMIINQDFSLDVPIVGVMLLFFAVGTAIVYGIAIKKLAVKYSSFTIIKTQNLLGALYFLPLFLIFDFNHFISVKPDWNLILALLQLAIFASSAAYMLFVPVVRQLGINKANIFTNFIPVFTATFSYILLSEIMSFNKLIGIVIVIAGVFLSQINQNSVIQFGRRVYNGRGKPDG
jgi:drug/metabolite transporter (DMT)-like permease